MSAIQDIARENPDVPGCYPAGSFTANPDGVQASSLVDDALALTRSPGFSGQPETALSRYSLGMAVKEIFARLLALFVWMLAPGYVAAQTPQFTIQDLGTLPNLPACNATALSQSGNVVGYCTSSTGQNLLLNAPTTHVFLYSNGVMTDLNITTPPSAFPTAVNDSGTVVGGDVMLSLLSESATASPFIYQNGMSQSILGSLQSLLPLGLNNAGQMVGTSIQVNTSSLNFFINSKAFLDPLASGVPTQLTFSGGTSAAFGINASGVIAGASGQPNLTGVTPLLWQQNLMPQALPLLSGFEQEIATSVNDSGVAAGTAFELNFTELSDPTASAHAVLFNSGSVTDLGVLPLDASSMALGINNSGSVVGFSSSKAPDFTLHLAAYLYPPANNYHAFLYSGGKMYNLNNLLVNGTGWQLSFATQINNAGQIVGSGLFQGPNGGNVQHAFLLTPASGPNVTAIVGAAFSTPAVSSISANGIFTIFGNNLASTPQGLGTLVDNQLPTDLGGICVESAGTRWGLFYVSSGQINALAGPLPASGTVPVTVVTNCGAANQVSSAAVNVPVAAVAPEFLYFLENANGQNPVAALQAANGSSPKGTNVGTPGLISGVNFAPAHPGDILTAYGVGWGPTTSSDSIGTLASAAAQLTSSYSLTLGGNPVVPSYIGLSPDSAGLYQVNFTVPAGLAAGNQPLVLTVDGVTTTTNAFIAIGD